MDTLESAAPPSRQPDKVEAVCWECGERRTCFEYVVCCTGTTFHVCDDCERKIQDRDEPSACPDAPSL